MWDSRKAVSWLLVALSLLWASGATARVENSETDLACIMQVFGEDPRAKLYIGSSDRGGNLLLSVTGAAFDRGMAIPMDIRFDGGSLLSLSFTTLGGENSYSEPGNTAFRDFLVGFQTGAVMSLTFSNGYSVRYPLVRTIEATNAWLDCNARKGNFPR
jgi:hypothetical protein